MFHGDAIAEISFKTDRLLVRERIISESQFWVVVFVAEGADSEQVDDKGVLYTRNMYKTG